MFIAAEGRKKKLFKIQKKLGAKSNIKEERKKKSFVSAGGHQKHKVLH